MECILESSESSGSSSSLPHLQTTANNCLSQRVTQMPRTVRLSYLINFLYNITIEFIATLKNVKKNKSTITRIVQNITRIKLQKLHRQS